MFTSGKPISLILLLATLLPTRKNLIKNKYTKLKTTKALVEQLEALVAKTGERGHHVGKAAGH